MDCRIRRCRQDDLRKLEWDGLFTHHREIIERTWRQHRTGRQVMLVAEAGGAPVAQVWIDLARARSRRTAIIWALRVHPALQGRGIGTRVLREAETVIRRRGFAAAELVVENGNEHAQRLYKRLGYREARRLGQSYHYTTPDGHVREHRLDLVEMVKELR